LLGDAKSSLGDAKSSLGDAKSSLRDAKSLLGDAKRDEDVAWENVHQAKRLTLPRRAASVVVVAVLLLATLAVVASFRSLVRRYSERKSCDRNVREGLRVGGRSRGRFATPADSSLHDGTPYRRDTRTTRKFGICPSFKDQFLLLAAMLRE
jgi:hypothetical protein